MSFEHYIKQCYNMMQLQYYRVSISYELKLKALLNKNKYIKWI